MSNIKIEFCIIGEDFIPEEITKMLNIYPTEAFRNNDEFMGGSEKNIPMKRKECCWCIDTQYVESIDVIVELNKIYNILKDKTHILKEIKNKYSVFFKFDIIIHFTDNPIISLERDIIKFAAEIDAEIDFDTYI